MAALHQRNRLVIFRVTPEEYSSLMSACVAAGSRSLSDYTRSELFAMRQADLLGSVVERRFMEIDRKLSDLHALIKHVSERMTALNGGRHDAVCQ
jgi:hypothetical protein